MPRKLFSFLAELFFTLSALVLLFLIYQIWFTTEVAKTQQDLVAEEFEAILTERGSATKASGGQEILGERPIEVIETADLQGLGLLYIPTLRDRVWGLPVISGTDQQALSRGVGHYTSTELPGETGNFGIAGHRATNGEPFAFFERLSVGDMVYLQTTAGWFSYQLAQDRKIQDTEVWVLEDDPIGLGEQNLITLTTCDPRWNSTRRWAWWGVQVDFSIEAPSEVR